MKIEVTYQKNDILQLVLDELKRKGLKPLGDVVYKGALEVRMYVEIGSLDLAPQQVPIPIPSTSSEQDDGGFDSASEDEDTEEDFEAVLAESAKVAKTTKPKFARNLKEGEYLTLEDLEASRGK